MGILYNRDIYPMLCNFFITDFISLNIMKFQEMEICRQRAWDYKVQAFVDREERIIMESEKRTFRELWRERLWIRVTASVLALAMVFALAAHGIVMYLLNRNIALQEQAQQEKHTRQEKQQETYDDAFRMAGAAAQEEDFEAAAEQLSICLNLTDAGSTQEAELLTTRASLYILMGENQQALADLNRITEIGSPSTDVLLLKAQTELGMENHEAAMKDMEAILNLEPENYTVRLTLTQLYEMLENYDQAADSYLELLALRPGDPELRLEAARSQLLAGKTDIAQGLLNPILLDEEGENRASAYFLMALGDMQDQQLPAAMENLTAARKAGYDAMTCLEQLESCAFALGDYPMAMDYFQQMKEDTENPESWQQAGISAMVLGKYEKGIRLLDRAISLDPGYPGSPYYRGLCRFNLQQWQAAAEDFTASLNQEYMVQNSCYNRGLCYAQLLDYDKAIKDLERTVTYGGDSELTDTARELLPGLREAIQRK